MLFGSPVLRLSPFWERDSALVLVPALAAIAMCREGGWGKVEKGGAIWDIDNLRGSERERMLGDLRGAAHRLIPFCPDLARTGDQELIELLGTALRGGSVVALRQMQVTSVPNATAVLRRLVAQIERATRGKLSYFGRRYKLVADVDLARTPDRNQHEIASQVEARAVLDGLAREPGAPTEALGQAKEKLSKDWSSPFSGPEGLVLLRRIPIRASVPRDTGPAITPSQMKASLERAKRSLSNPRWKHEDKQRDGESPNAVLHGDVIALYADVQGAPNGTSVCFEILDETADPPTPLDTLCGPNQAGVAKVVWNVRDLAKSHVPKTELKASFTASMEDQRTEDCPIPHIPEMGQLHLMVRSLHLDRPFAKHEIVLSGQGIEVRGSLDEEGVFIHADEVPFGEYRLSIGEFATKVLAVRDGDPPFVVPAPPEAIPEERWRLKDMESEGAEFA